MYAVLDGGINLKLREEEGYWRVQRGYRSAQSYPEAGYWRACVSEVCGRMEYVVCASGECQVGVFEGVKRG